MTNEVAELFELASGDIGSSGYDDGGSKAASTQQEREEQHQEPREWSLDKNGVIVSKSIIEGASRSGSTTTTTRKIYYDMSGPTNPNHVFKCGTHDYETKSLRVQSTY